MAPGVGRVRGDGTLVRVDGLLELALGIEDHTEVGQGRCMVRIERQRAITRLHGFIQLPELAEAAGEIGQGCGGVAATDRGPPIAIARLILGSPVLKSLAIGGSGLRGPVLVGEQIPEIDPGAPMVRIAFDDGAVDLFGFRRPGLSGQGGRKVETRLDQIGIERERAAVRRLGLGKAREL